MPQGMKNEREHQGLLIKSLVRVAPFYGRAGQGE
jgi:hypothetical protein